MPGEKVIYKANDIDYGYSGDDQNNNTTQHRLHFYISHLLHTQDFPFKIRIGNPVKIRTLIIN